MCAQYIILLLSSHFLLLIMDGTKSLEGAKTTKKMTEDYVMCGSIDESPKSWTLDVCDSVGGSGGFFLVNHQ